MINFTLQYVNFSEKIPSYKLVEFQDRLKCLHRLSQSAMQ